jgi:hypothetical protein
MLRDLLTQKCYLNKNKAKTKPLLELVGKIGLWVVHLQDKVTISTKALWPGASFQNRSYGDRSSLF